MLQVCDWVIFNAAGVWLDDRRVIFPRSPLSSRCSLRNGQYSFRNAWLSFDNAYERNQKKTQTEHRTAIAHQYFKTLPLRQTQLRSCCASLISSVSNIVIKLLIIGTDSLSAHLFNRVLDTAEKEELNEQVWERKISCSPRFNCFLLTLVTPCYIHWSCLHYTWEKKTSSEKEKENKHSRNSNSLCFLFFFLKWVWLSLSINDSREHSIQRFTWWMAKIIR